MPPEPRDSPGLGFVVGFAGVAIITILEFALELPAAVPALALLIPVVASTTIASGRVGLFIAVLAAASFAVASAEPIGSPAMRIGADIAVLATFIVVALVVSYLIERRRRADSHVLDTRRVALLSGVSHDLRSPLTTIRAISSDLLEAPDLYDDQTRERMLERVVDESARLDRIVANLLSTVRIQAGALNPNFQSEPAAALIEYSVRRALRGDPTLRIDVDVPQTLPEVAVDPVQFDQAVTNLLENAIRHNASGEPVRVEARWPSPVAGERFVEIAVIDRGPGFSTSARSRLFQPFNATVSSTDSTGLGLTVCKAIIEAHGGAIWLGDAGGGDTTISFTVPVATDGEEPLGRP